MAVNVSPGITIRIHVTSDTDGYATRESVESVAKEAARKLDRNLGEDNAGKLLYIGADGGITHLALGDGLGIRDGVLMMISSVTVDEDGNAMLKGGSVIVDEEGNGTLTVGTLTVDEEGNAALA